MKRTVHINMFKFEIIICCFKNSLKLYIVANNSVIDEKLSCEIIDFYATIFNVIFFSNSNKKFISINVDKYFVLYFQNIRFIYSFC